MKTDRGGTLDKGKQELRSREGEKQKQYMGQSLTEKEQDLRLNLVALDHCTLAIVGICTSLFSSSSTNTVENIFCTSLISSSLLQNALFYTSFPRKLFK